MNHQPAPELEAHDPVAYPHNPLRDPRATRATYTIVEDPDELTEESDVSTE